MAEEIENLSEESVKDEKYEKKEEEEEEKEENQEDMLKQENPNNEECDENANNEENGENPKNEDENKTRGNEERENGETNENDINNEEISSDVGKCERNESNSDDTKNQDVQPEENAVKDEATENEDAEDDWKNENILTKETREEVSSMWEIPQVFHFLHLAKDTLCVPNLSMYEMERMLFMPKASKQLANVMTCLLSSSVTKTKLHKLPPMPYEFWTNVLTHKIKGWFKIYQSKHHDCIKVLESIGVEPEFWEIFPDSSCLSGKDFQDLSFKQKIWLVKTLCDTIMHARRTVQDEISKHEWDEQVETVLGVDRHGARYIYFPQFIDTDLRIYRHCLDNKVLSTIRAPKSLLPKRQIKNRKAKEKVYTKNPRNRRRKLRWKNGTIPTNRKKRVKKKVDQNSAANEENNSGNIEKNSNNNEIGSSALNLNAENSRGSKKDSKEDHSSKTDDEKLNEIMINSDTKFKDELNISSCSKSDDEKLNETSSLGIKVEKNNGEEKESVEENREKEKFFLKTNEKLSRKRQAEDSATNNEEGDEPEEKYSKVIYESDDEDFDLALQEVRIRLDDEEDSEDGDDEFDAANSWERPRRSRGSKKEESKNDLVYFNQLISDLKLSNFRLVVDSVESLRELIASFSTDNNLLCEERLTKRLIELLESLENREESLIESTKNARRKLQKELRNFEKGIGTSENKRNVNCWVLGTQGYPNQSSCQLDNQEDYHPIHEKGEHEENETNRQDTRRVLRARGISSYTEQFYSEDDENEEDQLEGFADIAAIYASPCILTSANTTLKLLEDDKSEKDDSDQDWILPSSRKRRHKRQSAARRLKSFQTKLQNIKMDTGELSLHSSEIEMLSSTNGAMSDTKADIAISPLTAATATTTTATTTITTTTTPISSVTTTSKSKLLLRNQETIVPSICKIESVDSLHSEIDIKEEPPEQQHQQQQHQQQQQMNYNLNPQQNYVVVKTEPTTPMNYYVMQQNSLQPNNLMQPPSMLGQPNMIVSNMMPPHLAQNYYMQSPQNYLLPQQPMINVQQPFMNHPNYGMQYMVGSMPQQMPPQIPVQPPPQHPPSQPVLLRGNIPQRYAYPSPPRPKTLQNSPRLNFPHPNGAVIRSNGLPMRNSNNGGAPRRIYPKPRHIRPLAPPRPQPPAAGSKPKHAGSSTSATSSTPGSKTTSVIVLSDSDDEIEMIVTEKAANAAKNATNNRANNNNNNKSVVLKRPRQAAKSKPVITSEITISNTKNSLPPQIIQRMSQGGISITPVKPQQSVQQQLQQQPVQSVIQNSNTQLVVVVNETGSHYALALPNGSKLILTPDQVAQIRASNGGKLIL